MAQFFAGVEAPDGASAIDRDRLKAERATGVGSGASAAAAKLAQGMAPMAGKQAVQIVMIIKVAGIAAMMRPTGQLCQQIWRQIGTINRYTQAPVAGRALQAGSQAG